MLKKLLGLFVACSAALSLLTGCTTATTTSGNELIDVSMVERFVVPGQSTLKEAREYLGTPILLGKSLNGKDFACFAFIGERGTGEAIGKGVADLLTLGIAKDKERQFVQKNVFVVYDENNVVQEIQYHGFAGIRFFGWFSYNLLALRELTDSELKENINYSKDYIIDSWKEYAVKERPMDIDNVALKKGKTIEQLKYDEVFYPFLGIPGIAQYSAVKLYKKYTDEKLNKVSGSETGDGSKMSLLLGR